MGEVNGLVWRLVDDREVVSVNKMPTPLCELLRAKAIFDGLASIDIENHILAPKMVPAPLQQCKPVRLPFIHQRMT